MPNRRAVLAMAVSARIVPLIAKICRIADFVEA
jgi:hypothetical protein